MEPIRVLHMIGSLNIGGSQTMVLNLYRSIDRRQIQFDFVIDHPEEVYLKPEVENLGAKVYVMPAYNGANLVQIKKSWKKFFLEHPEYKILHSHVRSYASLYIPIVKKMGIKTIIHSHSTSNGKGIKSFVKKVLQLPLRNQADCFMGCSKEAGEWLFGKKVVKSNKYFVLKNAIDTNLYRFNPVIRENYRKDLNLNGKIVYIHVGRFHPAKNHVFLLNLFAELQKQQNNAVLLLVGDGGLRSEIEAQIQALHIWDSVYLLGNRSDVANLLQAADRFLFPSLWEGLGIVAIEAQAAGLPTFCSDVVPNEIAVSNLCSFLPLNDPQIWADKILASDLSRQDCLQQVVDAGYDIQSTARWLQDFYLANAM